MKPIVPALILCLALLAAPARADLQRTPPRTLSAPTTPAPAEVYRPGASEAPPVEEPATLEAKIEATSPSALAAEPPPAEKHDRWLLTGVRGQILVHQAVPVVSTDFEDAGGSLRVSTGMGLRAESSRLAFEAAWTPVRYRFGSADFKGRMDQYSLVYLFRNPWRDRALYLGAGAVAVLSNTILLNNQTLLESFAGLRLVAGKTSSGRGLGIEVGATVPFDDTAPTLATLSLYVNLGKPRRK